jgi:O-antigen/teichoic acid export membrane protein
VIARLRASQTIRHGVIVFGGIVVASLFNYLFYMLMGRRLGVEGYGVVTSLASALLVVSAPALVGQLIAARLAADLEARGDAPALRRLADLITMWSLGVAGVVVALGLLAREPLAAFFNLVDSGPIVMTVIGLGIFLVVSVQRGVFQGAHQFGDLAASMSIESVTKVAFALMLVGALGPSGALLGLAISVLIALVYNLFTFHRRFGIRRAAVALDRGLIIRVISHVGLGQLTIILLSFYDVPLVKHLFDARSAGLYAAAALVGRAVLSAVAFVPILVLPKATARAAAGRSTVPLLVAALGLSAGIVGIAILCGALFPGFIVKLIAGAAFGEAAPLVFLYVLASGALALANVVAAYRMGLHQYDFVVPALVVALGEIGVLLVWHPTLVAVVTVLLTGHACVFAATLFRLNRTVPVTER